MPIAELLISTSELSILLGKLMVLIGCLAMLINESGIPFGNTTIKLGEFYGFVGFIVILLGGLSILVVD